MTERKLRDFRLAGLMAATFCLSAGPASAYVGPGAGLSAIGSILAFFGVVFLIIVGFFWYPIKRLIARFRSQKSPEAEEQDGQ